MESMATSQQKSSDAETEMHNGDRKHLDILNHSGTLPPRKGGMEESGIGYVENKPSDSRLESSSSNSPRIGNESTRFEDHIQENAIADTPRLGSRRSSKMEHSSKRPSESHLNRRASHDGHRPSMSSRSSTLPHAHRYNHEDDHEIPPAKHLRPLAGSARPLNINTKLGEKDETLLDPMPSPIPLDIPLPPVSLPTYLQLELSSQRPSPMYIHRSRSSDYPYESPRVKYERLLNFLRLPFHLEKVLVFGAFTCLDSWLFTFTILPIRFIKATWNVLVWILITMILLLKDSVGAIVQSPGRFWRKQKRPLHVATPARNISSTPASKHTASTSARKESSTPLDASNRIRKASSKQSPSQIIWRASTISPSTKADLLQGLLIIGSCMILLRFDASRMYHSIRGQAAIKLYVIYNTLEVFDRLFSALGQDILECLFCEDTLEFSKTSRTSFLRPLGLFLLALLYCVIHSTALFYQVVTLNVAVNSYSNALLTLLLSNQFVEIKGTVFKKFERENLFQLTCADVVERFQLWLMLLIIALRNIVEVGGLSINLGNTFASTTSIPGNASGTVPPPSNITSSPSRAFGIIPNSFMIMPSLIPFQVLGPFLIVLGSEMLVDWLKHAYITKFNGISPKIFDRFYDVLAKDYYSNAFSEQNLTRRLGLPVIPLACLFIRATLQTYHMFLATNVGPPSAHISTSTSLALNVDIAEPSASPLFAQLDQMFRKALGRSSLGGGGAAPGLPSSLQWTWTLDDAIALITMVVFFLALYMILLASKLVLGMVLLKVAQGRYKDFKRREHERVVEAGTRRLGGWGVVEVDEQKRRWIYDDDPAALSSLRSKEARAKDREKSSNSKGLEGVNRYSMVAKRIW